MPPLRHNIIDCGLRRNIIDCSLKCPVPRRLRDSEGRGGVAADMAILMTFILPLATHAKKVRLRIGDQNVSRQGKKVL